MAIGTNNNEIVIVDKESLKEKVYFIRGRQVMLDFELAEIYGYTTKRFNEQVKNNIDKFDDDFMFRLTRDEVDELVRSKKSTSRENNLFSGQAGGTRYLPHAFTEQGLYMLMTVLRGELATKQSKALIRLFKNMKDYIAENQPLISLKHYVTLAERIENHDKEIKEIKHNMVTHADLSDFMKIFDSNKGAEEVLVLDGQPFKADMAYQRIYRKARKSIIVVDDYIDSKTLYHLTKAKKNADLTIISDNRGKGLRLSEYEDYLAEYSEREIDFIKSNGRIHDRYIILDQGSSMMRVYHCGASSKDAGKRITTITEIKDISDYKNTILELLRNPKLQLR